MLKDFKAFIMRGNVLDLAVAVVIGGAFGTAESLRKKAGLMLSVSKFTLTHQMVRLILVEQIYRALTITRNEGYHHD